MEDKDEIKRNKKETKKKTTKGVEFAKFLNMIKSALITPVRDFLKVRRDISILEYVIGLFSPMILLTPNCEAAHQPALASKGCQVLTGEQWRSYS